MIPQVHAPSNSSSFAIEDTSVTLSKAYIKHLPYSPFSSRDVSHCHSAIQYICELYREINVERKGHHLSQHNLQMGHRTKVLR